MGTRATYSFIDNEEQYHIYKHWDGYPEGALQLIHSARKLAWDLPRFEASEFAAAFIASNKSSPGDINITLDPNNHWDTEYHYEIQLEGSELNVRIFELELGISDDRSPIPFKNRKRHVATGTLTNLIRQFTDAERS